MVTACAHNTNACHRFRQALDRNSSAPHLNASLTAMSHIHTYTELKRQIHEDLRTQHPEWIEPTAECPKCDDREARLNEVLEAVARSESDTEATRQNSS